LIELRRSTKAKTEEILVEADQRSLRIVLLTVIPIEPSRSIMTAAAQDLNFEMFETFATSLIMGRVYRPANVTKAA